MTDRILANVDFVLVVGPMRTGTTLVAELLDTHPDVAYLGFELSEQWADWTGLPWGAPGADDRHCPPLGPADATPGRVEAVRAGLARRLREHVGDGPLPTTVVLKNPHWWHRLAFVTAVLPTARIVRTCRGLLPTVASLQRLWQRSLAQHDRVHHLPNDPTSCWDYVPADEAAGLDPRRTFPGGDLAVLVEFLVRTDTTLDAATAETQATEVGHEQLLTNPDRVMVQLQRALEFTPHRLTPPEPLDASRINEWRRLLDGDAERAVRAAATAQGVDHLLQTSWITSERVLGQSNSGGCSSNSA